jgi:hypothetical protein
MKRTASEKKTARSKASSTKRSSGKSASAKATRVQCVVCIKSGGYVDLEPLKVYKVRSDARAAAEGLLRVVDASGDDYLYPAGFFRPIQAPPQLFKLVETAALEPGA